MLNLVNTGGFISWICCSIILIRFRKACDMQGVSRELLPIRSRLQPVGSWITLCAFTILCLCNGFTVFFPSEWSASSFLTAYVGLPLFIGIYFVHRIVHRQDPWAIPVDEIDLVTGLAEVEAAEKQPTVYNTWWGKGLSKLA
jgi:amino acid transporter